MVENREVKEIGVKFGFTTWHPNGNLLVFSMNMPRLLLHTRRNEMRDIVDVDSWIGYLDLRLNKAKAIPQLARKDRLENYPVFSPDGTYLYYTAAPKLWEDTKKIDTRHYDKVKYSLMRIPYQPQTDQWGEPQVILSSQETGLSINQPRVSPDGRWISFAMCAYGCWPSYHPNSDLYLLDLQSGTKTGGYSYKKMEINSAECESWQGWSANSRWLVFSSKRNNPLYNRTYIAYIDTSGRMNKSFVIPQKDPGYYESYLMTYTIPELLSEPLTVKGEDLVQVIRSAGKIEIDVPITGASPKQDSRQIYHQ
jgi:tricorn protease-like protein